MESSQKSTSKSNLRHTNASGSHGSSSNLQTVTDGEENTINYRIQAHEKEGIASGKKQISLWHDITLVHINPETNMPTPYLNFICEIPKFSRKKYEIATDEEGNPIKQDTSKGELREFKKGDIFFNYGCLPRTWEDPTHVHPDTMGCRGDNDPLDVCEIGLRIIQPGGIRPVKILGILCMIDDGEADWKVVTIDAEDKWAPFLNDISDVEKHLPGQLNAIREWFRTYKIPDGKPPNVFGLDERFMDKTYTMEIIKECNLAWKDLITGEKERNMSHVGEKVKGLVRKLSKSNLLSLADDNDNQDVDDTPCF